MLRESIRATSHTSKQFDRLPVCSEKTIAELCRLAEFKG
jgi:hypothetical protein